MRKTIIRLTDAPVSDPTAPVKIKQENPSPCRRASHHRGARARSLQEAFDATQDTSAPPSPNDKSTTPMIETTPSPEHPPAKKAKSSNRCAGCCACSSTSRCLDRRCSCRQRGQLCATCASKCCNNSNDSGCDSNATPAQLASTNPSPNQNTPSPLTQPTASDIFDIPSPASNEADDSSNDSEFHTGSTHAIPSQFGDLPNCDSAPMDVKLASVFDGECLRNNGGTQLEGGIEDDSA